MGEIIICDASSLITFSNTCFYDIFRFLRNKTGVEFVIPSIVRKEIIDRPLSIKMKAYQLSAVRLRDLLERNDFIEVDVEGEEKTNEIMNIANTIFFARGKPLHLVDRGEADMIALAHQLDARNLLMDERTTRMLIESPFRLKEHFEEELGVAVLLNRGNYERFRDYTKDMRVIRSAEVMAIAFKLGYFDKFRAHARESYEAALYALKYNGCSVSFDEIDYLKGIS